VEWQVEKVARAATGKHILLVEDEEQIRVLMEHVLAEAGYEVDSVDTAAVAKARIRSRRYDLVLTDGLLGDGNGMELADAAKAKGMLAVIVTGHTRALWRDLQRYAFLSKPLRPNELVHAVDSYIASAPT
jgi:DNA-binding NtrC family response regulator